MARASIGAHRLLRLSGIIFLARIAGAVLGMVVQLALVRWLGVDDYGLYALAISLGGVLGIVCVMGFPSIAARFLARYAADKKPGLANGFRLAGPRHLIAISIPMLLAVAAILFFSDLVDARYAPALFLGALGAPLIGLTRFNGALANVMRRNLLAYLPDLIGRPLAFIAMATILIWVFPGAGVVSILSIHVIALALVAIGLSIAINRHYAVNDGGASPEFDNAAWRGAGVRAMGIALATTALADLNILLVGMFRPAEEVAIFSICMRLMLLVQFGVMAIHQIVTPDIADAYAKNDHHAIKEAIRRAAQLNLSLVSLALIGAMAFGEFALGLFDQGFRVGWPVLFILLLSQIPRALFGPVTPIMNITGQEGQSLRICVAGTLALIGLNIVLLPGFSIAAAAWIYAFIAFAIAGLQAARIKNALGYLPVPVGADYDPSDKAYIPNQ